MTVTAMLSVAPVIEGSMSPHVARAVAALDDFDIEYETTPIGTILEADSADEIFRAAEAAHRAVDSDRVSTFLKVDDKRTWAGDAEEKVRSVEAELERRAASHQ